MIIYIIYQVCISVLKAKNDSPVQAFVMNTNNHRKLHVTLRVTKYFSVMLLNNLQKAFSDG